MITKLVQFISRFWSDQEQMIMESIVIPDNSSRTFLFLHIVVGVALLGVISHIFQLYKDKDWEGYRSVFGILLDVYVCQFLYEQLWGMNSKIILFNVLGVVGVVAALKHVCMAVMWFQKRVITYRTSSQPLFKIKVLMTKSFLSITNIALVVLCVDLLFLESYPQARITFMSEEMKWFFVFMFTIYTAQGLYSVLSDDRAFSKPVSEDGENGGGFDQSLETEDSEDSNDGGELIEKQSSPTASDKNL